MTTKPLDIECRVCGAEPGHRCTVATEHSRRGVPWYHIRRETDARHNFEAELKQELRSYKAEYDLSQDDVERIKDEMIENWITEGCTDFYALIGPDGDPHEAQFCPSQLLQVLWPAWSKANL